MDEVLERGAGFTIADTTPASLEAAVEWALRTRGTAIRERAREVGLEEFGLTGCVERYGRLLA